MLQVLKFSSFDEMKAHELQLIPVQNGDDIEEKNLSAFVAISRLNPKNKTHINIENESNEFRQTID
jgi:hypothetical protein